MLHKRECHDKRLMKWDAENDAVKSLECTAKNQLVGKSISKLTYLCMMQAMEVYIMSTEIG